MITHAKVATPHGAAYARRLCKHFSHKIPATAEGNHSRIEFPFGPCTIDCDDESMLISVELTDASEVDKAERVVGDHLLRMANKDEPTVVWRRNSS